MNTEKPRIPNVFLPYYDPAQNMSGWQFGFPPQTDMSTDIDVTIVDEETRNIYNGCPRISSEHKNGMLHGYPEWAWMYVKDMSDQMHNVRIEAPQRTQGSAPLVDAQQLAGRGLNKPLQFYTQAGLARFDVRQSQIDLDYNIPTGFFARSAGRKENQATQTAMIGIANIQFAIVRFDTEHILSIAPCNPATYMNLWTTHLAKMTMTAAMTEGSSLRDIEDNTLPTEIKQTVDKLRA